VAFLDVRDLSVSFVRNGSGEPFLALDGISLSVDRSDFIGIIGHSGCGKSTLLNAIGGLIAPSSGSITCDGVLVRGPGPDRAMVFQSHALLPWMTCYENVHLGARQVFEKTLTRVQIREKVENALRLVHLDHAMDKFPAEISGGMKQRVGIARALAIEPRLLLLDEPFGALDALTRASLQDELVRIVEATNSTVVMVTHDVDEAILLSDKIVMMTNGPAARIGDILAIGLSRPRDRLALATDPDFAKYRQQLLDFLYRKQRQAHIADNETIRDKKAAS
jgi:nitrate/nitrite transport system ATP-binding protein